MNLYTSGWGLATKALVPWTPLPPYKLLRLSSEPLRNHSELLKLPNEWLLVKKGASRIPEWFSTTPKGAFMPPWEGLFSSWVSLSVSNTKLLWFNSEYIQLLCDLWLQGNPLYVALRWASMIFRVPLRLQGELLRLQSEPLLPPPPQGWALTTSW
jgi:hypothetical protein